VALSKVLLVFPGQGAQYRGMGADLVEQFPVARELYSRASDVLGYDLAELSFRDPSDQLNLTRFTQPALLTHEVACLESLRSLVGERSQPALVAGHSLGEYSALVAAGALGFEAAVGLVQRRGMLMTQFGRGGMLATALDVAAASALADKHFCGIGACNLPDQTVVAGESADLDALAADMAVLYPAKRGVRLNTEGAFHSYLMVGAAGEFRKVLEETEFGALTVSALSNYTGKLHESSSQAIRSRLFFQLFNPVQWYGCLTTATDAGIDGVIELGGGIGKGEGPEGKRPNLEAIVKKSLKTRGHEAQYLPGISAATIRATAEQLSGG
jgi:[acyl-carrier-protein] S-malonyltransferase